MKTLATALCAILGALAISAPTYADTPANATASDLSSISVKIGAKAYSGTDARDLLVSRAKAMENMRKTTEAKKKFLKQFVIKLSKLAGNYEKRGGKSRDLAKVLRAVETELKSEILTLSGNVASSSSVVNLNITQNNSTTGGLGGDAQGVQAYNNADETGKRKIRIMTEIAPDIDYSKNTLKLTRAQFIERFNKYYTSEEYRKIALEMWDGGAKPSVISTTGSTNSTKSTPVTSTIGGGSNVEVGYKASIAKASTAQQKFYVKVLYETITSMPREGWKDSETAINYMLQTHSGDYKVYPITVKKIITQAVNDALDNKVGAKYLDESFKMLPKDNSADTGTATSKLTPVTSSIGGGSNVDVGYKASMAKASTAPEKFYVNILYNTVTFAPSTGWSSEKDAYDYMVRAYVTWKKFPIDSEKIVKQAVHDALNGKVGVQYLEEAFKTLPTSFTK